MEMLFTPGECDEIGSRYWRENKIFEALAFFNEARANCISTARTYFDNKITVCKNRLGI